MDLQINIACQGSTNLSIDEINDFQGNLKTLSPENYEKFKSEILRHGFSEPVSVWKDPASNSYKCLNGHQRLRTLRLMRDEGYKVPDVPVSLISAKDWKEAKEKVLALTSQYGTIDDQGLQQFISDAGIDVDFLSTSIVIPEINLNYFVQEVVAPPAGDRLSESVSGAGAINQTVLVFSPQEKQEYLQLVEIVMKKGGFESASDAVLGALREY